MSHVTRDGIGTQRKTSPHVTTPTLTTSSTGPCHRIEMNRIAWMGRRNCEQNDVIVLHEDEEAGICKLLPSRRGRNGDSFRTCFSKRKGLDEERATTVSECCERERLDALEND